MRELRRELGLRFGIAAVVGGSIGTGVLRAEGPIAAAVPHAGLLVAIWLAGGVIALVEAFPLLELATAMPRAGGLAVYARRAFGDAAGAAVGWANWLQCVLSIAFMAVVFGEYVHRLSVLDAVPTGVLAVSLVTVLTLVNCLHTRVAGASQTLGSALKLAVFAAVIGLLFALPPAPPRPAAPPGSVTPGGVILALLLVTNTYSGWGDAIVFAEEVRRPARTVARAVLLGIAAITLVYVGMAAGLIRALGTADIAGSVLPLADAARRLGSDQADRLVTVVSLVSVVTVANLSLMVPPRIVLDMARWGAAPAMVDGVAANGAPRAATILTGVAAAALASSGAYVLLNQIFAPVAGCVAIATLLAAIRLRRTEPELARPRPMPAYPWPAVLALLVNGLLLLGFAAAEPGATAGGFALLAGELGLVALWWRRRRPDQAGDAAP